MKKLFLISIFLLTLILTPSVTLAQSMTGTQLPVSSDNHTASEEQEGKETWEKLQAKETTCDKLSDEDFASLGEYFMGQMAGSSHEAMNTMMENMMGKQGEEQMHIAMGKRLSSCDSNAQVPSSGVGLMPMMWMMGGGGNPMMGYGGWNNMMDGWGGFGMLGWLFMIIFWVLIILGIVVLIRYLGSSGKSGDKEKTPLEILKERYAKGEINKKEFEEKKKDLS